MAIDLSQNKELSSLISKDKISAKFLENINRGDIVVVDYDENNNQALARKLITNLSDVPLTYQMLGEAAGGVGWIVQLDETTGVFGYTSNSAFIMIPFKVNDDKSMSFGSAARYSDKTYIGLVHGVKISDSTGIFAVYATSSPCVTLYGFYLDKNTLSISSSTTTVSTGYYSSSYRLRLIPLAYNKCAVIYGNDSNYAYWSYFSYTVSSSSISLSSPSTEASLPDNYMWQGTGCSLPDGSGLVLHASSNFWYIYRLIPTTTAVNIISIKSGYSEYPSASTARFYDAVSFENGVAFIYGTNLYFMRCIPALNFFDYYNTQLISTNFSYFAYLYNYISNNIQTLIALSSGGRSIKLFRRESDTNFISQSYTIVYNSCGLVISNGNFYVLESVYPNATVFCNTGIALLYNGSASSKQSNLKLPLYSDTISRYADNAHAALLNSNTVVEAFVGSVIGYIRLGTINTDNTIIWTSPIQFASSVANLNGIGTSIKVVITGTNTGVIIYGYSSTLYAIAFSIDNNTFTFGTAVSLSSSFSSSYSIDAVLIDTDKIAVTSVNSSNYPIAVILTKNNLTLSFGTSVVIYSGSPGNGQSAIISKLGTNKFLVSYVYSSTVGCKVATVSGTTISLGSETSVGSGGYVQAISVSTDSAVIYRPSYLSIISVSGTTATVSNNINYSWLLSSWIPFDFKLTGNYAILALKENASEYCLMHVIFDISNNYAVYGESCLSRINFNTSYALGYVLPIDSTKFLLGHAYSSFYAHGLYSIDNNEYDSLLTLTDISQSVFRPINQTQILRVCYTSSLYVQIIEKTPLGFVGYSQTTISGNSISSYILEQLDTNKFVVGYYCPGNGYVYANVLTVSGTSVSVGSSSYFYTSTYIDGKQLSIAVLDISKFVCAYGYNSPTYVCVGTVSGTSVSFGSVYNYNGYGQIIAIDNTRCALFAYDGAYVLSISGTSVSATSQYTYPTSFYGTSYTVRAIKNGSDYIVFGQIYQNSQYYLYSYTFTLNGNSFTLKNSTQYNSINSSSAYRLYNVINSGSHYLLYTANGATGHNTYIFNNDNSVTYLRSLLSARVPFLLNSNSYVSYGNSLGLIVKIDPQQNDVSYYYLKQTPMIYLNSPNSATQIRIVKVKDDFYAVGYLANTDLYCSFIKKDSSGNYTITTTYITTSVNSFDLVAANHSAIAIAYRSSSNMYICSLTTGGSLGSALSWTCDSAATPSIFRVGYNRVALFFRYDATYTSGCLLNVDGSYMSTIASSSSLLSTTLAAFAQGQSDTIYALYYSSGFKIVPITCGNNFNTSTAVSVTLPSTITNITAFGRSCYVPSKNMVVFSIIYNNILYLILYDPLTATVKDTRLVAQVNYTDSPASKGFDLMISPDEKIFVIYSTSTSYSIRTLQVFNITSSNQFQLETTYQLGRGYYVSAVYEKTASGNEFIVTTNSQAISQYDINIDMLYPLPYWKNLGIAEESGNADEIHQISTYGDITSAFSNLLPRQPYYINTKNGKLTINKDTVLFGYALSTNMMLIKPKLSESQDFLSFKY